MSRRLALLTTIAAASVAPWSPTEAALQSGPPRLVVVLDGSLSMVVREDAAAPGQPGRRRFDVARDDLIETLRHLRGRRPATEFRLLAFGPAGGGPNGLWAFPAQAGAFATLDRLGEAERWLTTTLAAVAPRGQSRLATALEQALKLGPDRVLCYSDGVPMPRRSAGGAARGGADAASDAIEAERQGVLTNIRFWNTRNPATPVDVVGVGARMQSAQNFLRALAGETGGYFLATD